MHRTRTATTLLLGVAVSAVSGCVSVDPAPSPVPARHEPRLIREDEQKRVQAPAREALDAAPQVLKTPAPKPVYARPVAPPSGRESAAVPPLPPRAGGPDEGTPPARRMPPSLPVATVDVCTLGKEYGGWRADSPETRICRDAYGN